MRLYELEKGDLRWEMDEPTDREYVEDSMKDGDYCEALSTTLEYYSANGSYTLLTEWETAQLGMLTSAPVIASEPMRGLLYDDFGNDREPTEAEMSTVKFWWHPNYAMEDERETLLHDGHFDFTLAK